MRTHLRSAIAFVYPRRCAGCDRVLEHASAFCGACVVTLVPGGEACCPRCGLVYLEPDPVAPVHTCGACAATPPPWRHARAAYAYGGAIQDALARWKNAPEQSLGPTLSRLFAGAPLASPDLIARRGVVVPVPGHRRRVRRRGFHPAGLLARATARALGLPLVGTALRATREVSSKGLGRKARQRRVRGAFVARGRRALRGRPVLLVDDVMTTGATAEAVTRALLRAGATFVDVAVLARAGG